MINKPKYVHLEEFHNTESPNYIVPILFDIFKPKSVLDVGCGIGTFLYEFKQVGVKEVLGIDGDWVDNMLLHKYLKPDEFQSIDLEKEFHFGKRFDLVLSLEVAEHIDIRNSDNFVKNLVNHGDIIVFSAAIPLQGGSNHKNEQWPSYWASIFQNYGYKFHDLIRPIIWNNENIFWWYKQNIFVAIKNDLIISWNNEIILSRYSKYLDIVHPDLYTIKTSRLDQIEKGKKRIRFYTKLLFRSLLTRISNFKYDS